MTLTGGEDLGGGDRRIRVSKNHPIPPYSRFELRNSMSNLSLRKWLFHIRATRGGRFPRRPGRPLSCTPSMQGDQICCPEQAVKGVPW